MGRAPCCDKANVKKGPWSPDEDAKLKAYIEANGNGSNWIALPQKIGLKRCGKSCRLRWLNYLRPNIKHGGFSEEEDNIICSLYISIGSRWSIIAAQLPGRTDNDIKNYWNTRLKKKLLGKQRKEQQARRAAAANCQLAFKHEMKRETNHENYMLPGMMSQIPYWQQLPASTLMPLPASTNQDQESSRSLLLKLGGRFFDDHTAAVAVQSSTNPMNLRYPTDVPFAHQGHHQLYENSMNIISSSSSTISTQMNSTCSQVINSTNFNVNENTPVSSRPETNMFEGLEGYPSELSELIYSLESNLYGADNMVDGSSNGTSSVESSSWGDMNSLGYPQILSGFEACQPNMPQVSTLDESSYLGPQ